MSDASISGHAGAGRPAPRLVLATRGSPLALAQSEMAAGWLTRRNPELTVTRQVLRTSGDRFLDVNLAEIGGKGLFTKELDEALLARAADLAVHSMKDLPTRLPDGLVLAGMLPREDARDVFIAKGGGGIAALPRGARIGTSSLRRAAQMRHRRGDLAIVPFRGNVETRLRKLAAGEAEATLLALAGLRRLGLVAAGGDYPGGVTLALDEILPAPGQGAIGLVCRAEDGDLRGLIAALNHDETFTAVTAERAALAALDGSCRTPIAALATLAGDRLRLRVVIFTPDGDRLLETARDGAAADAERMGADAGAELRGRAGPGFFASVGSAAGQS